MADAPPVRSPISAPASAAAALACGRFMAAVNRNLDDAAGTSFPDFRDLPIPRLLPWKVRIRRVVRVVDFSDQWLRFVAADAAAEPWEEWPADWQGWMRSVNRLELFELTGVGGRLFVVAGFVTRVHVAAWDSPPVFEAPGDREVRLAADVLRRRLGDLGRDPAAVTLIGLGAPLAWTVGRDALAGGGRWLVLSSPAGEDQHGLTWSTLDPGRRDDALATRELFDRLKPETADVRSRRVDEAVQQCIELTSVRRLGDELGYRSVVVRDECLRLQDKGVCVLAERGGVIYVRRARADERGGAAAWKPTVRASRYRVGWVRRAVPPATVLLGSGASAFGEYMSAGAAFNAWKYAYSVPAALIVSVLMKALERRLEVKE